MPQSKLCRLFNIKAYGLSAAILTQIAGCSIIGQTPVPLTDGEKKLSQDIFGDAVNTAIVRKYFSDKDPKGTAATAYGSRDIVFFRPYHSDDYSNKNKPYKLGLFLHEMTHIWQSQNLSIFKLLAKKCDTYPYHLSPDSKFGDFCNEQQASMVQDYGSYFLTSRPHDPRRMKNKDKDEGIRLLKEMIERKFPAAKQARLENEEKRGRLQKMRNKVYHKENNIKPGPAPYF